MSFPCWIAPVTNTTHTYTDLADNYFINGYMNLTTRRAMLIKMLGNLSTSKYAEFLKIDDGLEARMKNFEALLSRSASESAILKSAPEYYSASCYATRNLWRYLPPILLVLGTIGNALSFLVMCQKSMVHTSTYVYLAALAIVDEAVLLFGLLPAWIDKITGFMSLWMNPF